MDKSAEPIDISTDTHEPEDVQIHTTFTESSLTSFGDEQDVESVDEHGVDVCSGTGSVDSHVEGSQDVGSCEGHIVGRFERGQIERW